MLNSSPPLPPAATTLVTAVFKFCHVGNAEQSAKAGLASIKMRAAVENEAIRF
jgi:hypothetical protein